MRILLAVALLAVAGFIGWRVLSPAEVVEAATTPYPSMPVVTPGVTGKTTMAPLIVDGRIRVYAGKRLVKADGPIEAKTMYTPRWSYRRWPAQVSGIVAAGATVVSRWTDGVLVALDGRTGKVLWKADGPAADPFEGRTGSDAVWDPPGLTVSGETVVVTEADQRMALSAADGSRVSTIPPSVSTNLHVTAADGVVAASGAASWRWAGEATVLGVRGQKVILLGADQTLVELDARTGAELISFPLYTKNERVEPWKPYRWHLTDGWLAVERLLPEATTDPDELKHYYTMDPVVIAAL